MFVARQCRALNIKSACVKLQFEYTGCNYDSYVNRLQEICENPQFIVDGVARFDMGQGALGKLFIK